MRRYILSLGIMSGISFWCLTALNSAQAQIVPDATLPNNSAVTILDNINTITEGTVAGNNLFHSFKLFNINQGNIADFVSPSTAIQNILVRVTGGNRSEILGTLSTSGFSNPNLFLINPHGIIFGSNASLNVGGSFVATTANAIQFGEQGFFRAIEPNNPALLTINPSALVFNQMTSSITNQSIGGLEVPAGQSLLLVGGNVNVDSGSLLAVGGRIELGAVAGEGAVGFDADGNNLRLNFPDNVARADIAIINGSFIDVSAAGGGSLAVHARNLEISGGSSLLGGIFGGDGIPAGDIALDATERITITNGFIFNDVADVLTTTDTGGIYIKAESVSINDGSFLSASTFSQGSTAGVFIQTNDSVSIANGSSISSDVIPGSVGNTGGVNIRTGSFSLTNSSLLSANTFGQGNTAGVFVQANNFASIANNSVISTRAGAIPAMGTSNGGNINIQAADVSLTDNSLLQTSSSTAGVAGNVIINGQNTVSLDNSFILSDASGSANGGLIDIRARTLSLTNGAELLARALGENKGGNIQITAPESVTISGVNPDTGNLISGLITSTEGTATGQGGDISIMTGNLRVADGAVVSARSRSAGNGGDINVVANTVELTGGGQLLTSAFSGGNAGSISVTASDRVSIAGSDPTFAARLEEFGEELIDNDGPNSGLFARVRGNQVADAGNIEVTARSVRLDNQGTITTGTTLGEGGNISLNVDDLLLLRNNSNITASAGTANAGGNGGNINIDTTFLVAIPSEDSDISANAFTGQGGRIDIDAQSIFGIESRPNQTSFSDITASSEFGESGEIIINTPEIDPIQGLIQLPTTVVDASGLIDTSCVTGNGKGSQFIVTGRGGLPPSPYEPLNNDIVWSDTRITQTTGARKQSINNTFSSGNSPSAIIPATGWVFNSSGEVTLISHTPLATRHRSGNCMSS